MASHACCEHCEKCVADIHLEATESPASEESSERQLLLRLGIAAIVCGINLFMHHQGGIGETAYVLGFIVSWLIVGWDALADAMDNMMHGRIFDENLLMCIAGIAAFCIGEFAEGVAVIWLYRLGELCEDKAIGKSKRSIAALLDLRPDRVHIMSDGETKTLDPADVHPGDKIIVRPGERIALDGVIRSGRSTLDMSALTGESLPVNVSEQDAVMSGSVNLSEVLTIEVTKPYGESTASKIIDMVRNAASRKAPAEQFITRFARYYTPIVVVLAVLIALVVPLVWDGGWSEWIRRACVFLVISCPCALVISVPLTFFAGLSAASRCGILVKGSNYLESLGSLHTVVFDKTGTLTKGSFEVTAVLPASADIGEADVMEAACVAEFLSNHPIARAIVAHAEKQGTTLPVHEKYGEYKEIAGRGTHAAYGESKICAGNAAFMEEMGVAGSTLVQSDATGSFIHIIKDGVYLGMIIVEDVLKPETRTAIEALRQSGVKRAYMLTGDRKTAAEAVASQIKLDGYRAELLPSDKVAAFEELTAEVPAKQKVAFVGDGLNDAPVLARADVGIAMGGRGTDAAIEAADVVIMNDDLSRLGKGMEVASKTRTIVLENIAFALCVKGSFLILGALGFMNLWFAVFADVGVMLLAVMNAMRAMRLR